MKFDRVLTIYSAVISTMILLAVASYFISYSWLFQNKSAAIVYLVNEKPSLMDWGVNNLGEAVRKTDTPLLKKHGEIVSFLGNKIQINSSTSWEYAPDEDTAIKWCKGLILELKERFKVDAITGKPKYGSSSSVFVYFQHEGYKTKSEPEKLGELLDEIVELSAVVHINDSEKKIECHSPILSPDVIFGKSDYGT